MRQGGGFRGDVENFKAPRVLHGYFVHPRRIESRGGGMLESQALLGDIITEEKPLTAATDDSCLWIQDFVDASKVLHECGGRAAAVSRLIIRHVVWPATKQLLLLTVFWIMCVRWSMIAGEGATPLVWMSATLLASALVRAAVVSRAVRALGKAHDLHLEACSHRSRDAYEGSWNPDMQRRVAAILAARTYHAWMPTHVQCVFTRFEDVLSACLARDAPLCRLVPNEYVWAVLTWLLRASFSKAANRFRFGESDVVASCALRAMACAVTVSLPWLLVSAALDALVCDDSVIGPSMTAEGQRQIRRPLESSLTLRMRQRCVAVRLLQMDARTETNVGSNCTFAILIAVLTAAGVLASSSTFPLLLGGCVAYAARVADAYDARSTLLPWERVETDLCDLLVGSAAADAGCTAAAHHRLLRPSVLPWWRRWTAVAASVITLPWLLGVALPERLSTLRRILDSETEEHALCGLVAKQCLPHIRYT